MAWETSKEELVTEAKLREQLGPERNQRGGKGDKEPAPRERPHHHEIVPGAVFALGAFPSTVDGVPPGQDLPWPARYKAQRDYWLRPPGEKGSIFYYTFEKGWRVRVVTKPVRGSKITLVERCCDGRLGIVDLDLLRFCWAMKEVY